MILRAAVECNLNLVGMMSPIGHETDMPTALRNVRSQRAGSTGRRNTGVKSLCWGFKLQGLTRPFVELTSHFVQIGLRVPAIFAGTAAHTAAFRDVIVSS